MIVFGACRRTRSGPRAIPWSWSLGLFLLLLQTSPSAGQTILALAGNGTQGFAGDGGLPTSAQLYLPSGVHGDTVGVLYIADTANHRIRRVSATRDTITTVAGSGTAGYSGDAGAAPSAKLDGPAGVFRDRQGNLYIADTQNHCIRKVVLSTGVITTVAGTGTAGYRDTTVAAAARFRFPSAVFVDSAGSVFVADTGNNRIRRIAADGKVTTVAGTGTAGSAGDGGKAASAQLNGPAALYIDRAGNIYVADTSNHRIRRISAADSTIATIAGTGTAGYSGDGSLATNARLSFPAGVWVLSDSSVYIADRWNHRVRRVNPAGDITTIAGTGEYGGAGDTGPANLATLFTPSGLYIDSAGYLYLADTGNHRVRRVATVDAVGLANTGLSNGGHIGPAGEVRLLGVTLAGDDATTVRGLTFTVADLRDSLATGLSTADFAEFRLYESSDDTLSAVDRLLGTLDSSQVVLGSPATVTSSPARTPTRGTVVRYLLSAVISRGATQGHAVKVGFSTGGLATSQGGRGLRVAASDTHRVTIDAVATRLVFTTQPDLALSGSPLLVQPVVTALDDSGFVDLDFTRSVRLSTTGPGTLLRNTEAADQGVVRFTNLTYNAVADEEPFALVAQDLGNILPSVTSRTVVANAVNDTPRVDFPRLVMREDDPIGYRTRITSLITDADNPTLTITFTARHVLARVVGDSIVVTPPPDWAGLDTLTVVATDPFGLQGTDSAVIEVQPVNDPPVLQLPSSVTVAEDDTLRLDLVNQVTDPDQAFGELTWGFSPSSGLAARFDRALGRLSVWGPSESSGQYTLGIQVRDPYLATATASVRVEVTPVNDAPILLLPDTTISQGDSLRLDLRRYTTDPDHAVSQLTWTATDLLFGWGSAVAVRSPGMLVVRPPASYYGRDSVVVVATDPAGAVGRDTLSLEIRRINQTPVLSLPADTAVVAGDTLRWDLRSYAGDPDDPADSLRWTVSGAARATVSVTGGVLVFWTPAGTSVVERLQIRVSDPQNRSATDSLTVSVQPVVLPISGVPDLAFEAGRVFELPLAPYLNPAATEVIALPDSGLRVQLDPLTRIVTIVATGGFKGIARLVLLAMVPGVGSASDTARVEVLNPSPALLGFPDYYLDAGFSVQIPLDPYARDDEPVSSLRWSAEADSGLRVGIDPVSRTAEISADTSSSGSLQAIFTVADGQDATAVDTLRIFVNPAQPGGSDSTGTGNRAPSLGVMPAVVLVVGTPFNLALDAYAEDDGAVAYLLWTATVDPAGLVQVAIRPDHVAVFTALQARGEAVVTFRVADTGGLAATRPVAVRIQDTEEIAGDFDHDGTVDLDDFFRLADAMGLTSVHPDWDPVYDLDDDGMVSLDDFFRFADLFGSQGR